jgi:hypothetical protein
MSRTGRHDGHFRRQEAQCLPRTLEGAFQIPGHGTSRGVWCQQRQVRLETCPLVKSCFPYQHGKSASVDESKFPLCPSGDLQA